MVMTTRQVAINRYQSAVYFIFLSPCISCLTIHKKKLCTLENKYLDTFSFHKNKKLRL